MKLLVETHTHTLASDHAYSTVLENAAAAAKKGMQILCITDHGPDMQDSPHKMHFVNYQVVDRELYGVQMKLGVELNIIDYNGAVDLDEDILARQDICVAGFHPVVFAPGTKAENTRAYLGVMENPHIAIISHPEDGYVPLDFDEFVRAAVRNKVLVEVNNNSLKNATWRLNVRENLIEILKLCEKYGAMVSVGSDAHFASAIGSFELAEQLLAELDFPEELVINTSPERFIKHLESKH